MKWEHKCSLDWLKERQQYLTASEIKALLPVTKTGRPRKVTDMDRLKVLSGKLRELTEEDCMSYGAAARGHLLEPYAVREANKAIRKAVLSAGGETAEQFYWWDDFLVSDPRRSIAFSPDALNVPMTANIEAPTALMEVKSYSPDHHMATAYTDPLEREERWQLATPMALLSQIDHAYLVLFNPSMKAPGERLFLSIYDRDDLAKEIDMILEVEREWDEFLKRGCPLPTSTVNFSSELTEDEIVAELEQRQRLNP